MYGVTSSEYLKPSITQIYHIPINIYYNSVNAKNIRQFRENYQGNLEEHLRILMNYYKSKKISF